MDPRYYNVHVSWSNERKGIMYSPELKVETAQNGCIEVATPPQFPKGVEGVWTPKHIFTASVASCLVTTPLVIAENSKLPFKAFSCLAKGKLESDTEPVMMTEVALFPSVTLEEADQELTLGGLATSERACLIANSLKSEVAMHSSIEIFAESALP